MDGLGQKRNNKSNDTKEDVGFACLPLLFLFFSICVFGFLVSLAQNCFGKAKVSKPKKFSREQGIFTSVASLFSCISYALKCLSISRDESVSHSKWRRRLSLETGVLIKWEQARLVCIRKHGQILHSFFKTPISVCTTHPSLVLKKLAAKKHHKLVRIRAPSPPLWLIILCETKQK